MVQLRIMHDKVSGEDINVVCLQILAEDYVADDGGVEVGLQLVLESGGFLGELEVFLDVVL